MTVVVGVVAPDGLILAADSRSTWTENARHRITSDTSHKVFELLGRFGVATYGLAFIGPKTIAGLMDEFVAQLQPPPEGQERDVHDFALSLGQFFDQRLTAFAEETKQELPEGAWLLGFLVGGYDAEGIGHILEVNVPGGEIGEFFYTTAERGVMWRGQTDVIRRVVKGVDFDELSATGVEVPAQVSEALASLEYRLIFPISMQDAVDFAAFLIRTTIDMQRFSDGTNRSPGLVPGCGGPVRLLAVTGSGVEWVSEPALSLPLRTGQAEGALS